MELGVRDLLAGARDRLGARLRALGNAGAVSNAGEELARAAAARRMVERLERRFATRAPATAA